MSTSESVNEPSSYERTRGYADGRKTAPCATWLPAASAVFWRAGIGVLIAVGFAWLVVGTIYLDSLVGFVDPRDLAQIVGP